MSISDAKAESASDSGELWAEAEVFRRVASGDFLIALEMCSTPPANIEFAELGKRLWPVRSGPEAWSGFLRPSLVNFVASDDDVQTVYFQNPWSDVILVTRWSRSSEGGRFRIQHAAAMTGGVMRGMKPPYAVGQGWLKESAYAPEAVGQTNAKTSQSIYDYKGTFADSPLAKMQNSQVDAMLVGAALQMMEFQSGLLPLLTEQPGIGKAMRIFWNEVVAAAQRGSLAEVLPPGAPAKALSALPPGFWATLEPSAYLEAEGGAIAMYGSVLNPDLYIAFRYRGNAKKGKVTDFDIYQFSRFQKTTTTEE